jgi:hypothetical protein
MDAHDPIPEAGIGPILCDAAIDVVIGSDGEWANVYSTILAYAILAEGRIAGPVLYVLATAQPDPRQNGPWLLHADGSRRRPDLARPLSAADLFQVRGRVVQMRGLLHVAPG